MLDAFLARQPIYDRKLEVFGYELLFRSGASGHAEFADADQATSRLMLNAFMEIGLERIVGDRLAFFNLTRAFIMGDYPLPFPPGKGCLEILEDIKDRLVPRCTVCSPTIAGTGTRYIARC